MRERRRGQDWEGGGASFASTIVFKSRYHNAFKGHSRQSVMSFFAGSPRLSVRD